MSDDQLRFFDPDNPPQAWSKAEGNAKLETIKSQMRQAQMDRIAAHNVSKRKGDRDEQHF